MTRASAVHYRSAYTHLARREAAHSPPTPEPITRISTSSGGSALAVLAVRVAADEPMDEQGVQQAFVKRTLSAAREGAA